MAAMAGEHTTLILSINHHWGRLLLLLLVCMPILIRGQPSCNKLGTTLKCTMVENSDFSLLPAVAGDIHLSFKAGHSVVFQDSLFPELPALRNLTIDVYNLVDLSSGVFQKLTALEYLKLETSDPFRPLPELSLLKHTLSGLSSLQHLIIDEIGLTDIQADAFQDLTNLEILTMGNQYDEQNKIETLPNNLFVPTQLVSLSFINMGLKEIYSSTFQGLSRLQTLDLSNNKLTSIGAFVFREMTNLTVLRLSNNDILQLSTDAFQGLGKLKMLNIQKNDLTILRSALLRGLSDLDTLDVNNNDIEVIEDGIFDSSPNLQYIELYNNKIKQITSRTFSGLINLQFLDIYENQIRTISVNAFQDLSNLLILHLHNNQLLSLNPQSFAGVNVNVLTLQKNQLTTLPMGIFDSFKDLQLINLSDNPWQCDCDITWLHSWLSTKPGVHADKSGETTCAAPQEVQDLDLLQYTSDNYVSCNPTTAEPNDTQQTTAGLHKQPTAGEGEDKTPLLSNGQKIAIIVGSIALALLLIIITVIIVCCRHKKYAFWAPPKVDKTDGTKKPSNDLKYKARHQVGSFYQDPETGAVSAMWETESMRSDYVYNNDTDTLDKKSDTGKNKYVYDNPALDVDYTNDNTVVVVGTNGTTIKEVSLPVNTNGHVHTPTNSFHSSNESLPKNMAVPIDTNLKQDIDTIATPEEVPMEDIKKQAPELESDFGSEHAHSISSLSDASIEDVATEIPEYTAQPVVDSIPERSTSDSGAALHVNVNLTSDEYSLNSEEPDTPQSAGDYEGLRQSVADSEHDYDHLVKNHVQDSPSTDAHGGTVAYEIDAPNNIVEDEHTTPHGYNSYDSDLNKQSLSA